MKKIVLTFGVVSGALIIIYTFGTFLFLGDPTEMSPDNLMIAEVLGYLRYLILIVTVFFAMRTFKQQSLQSSYWKIVKAGLFVSIVVGILVGLMELIYIAYNPEFFDAYAKIHVEGMIQRGATAAEIADFHATMDSLAWIRSPLATGFFYCAQMIVLGGIVALIIGIFMRSRTKPQLANV